jgi:WD40 repeat protein
VDGAIATVAVVEHCNATEEATHPPRTPRQVIGACFSPDGKRLATASLGQTAKVWEGGEPGPDRQRLFLRFVSDPYTIWLLSLGKPRVGFAGPSSYQSGD